jgi:hypothetical protein
MAAVAEQDANGVEEGGDVLRHGVAGLILWRIGLGGGMGRVEFHDSISNKIGQARQGLFSAYAAWVGRLGRATVEARTVAIAYW